MSLLNEMLRDLAKKEPPRQLPPTLKAASVASINARRAIIVLCGLSLALFALAIFLINNQTVTKTIKVAENKPAISKKVSKTNVVSNVVSKKVNDLPTENINLSSYIEPLYSLASFRVELQQYTALQEEPVNEWVEVQDEIQNQATAASVNKIYAPLTRDEWRDAQLNKALKDIENGFDERAIEILEAILIKMPDAMDVRENLASLYLASGDYARTTRIVDDGLKYSPADAALITIKARLLLDQGKTEVAIKLLSGYRPPLTSFPDFYGTLAAALQSEGRVMEAGGLYKALLQIDPDNGQYWLGYGISLEHNHQSNQAIQAYTKAIQNPDSDPSVRNYAESRLKTLQG